MKKLTNQEACSFFSVLSNPTRLSILRLLVNASYPGLKSHELMEKLDISYSSLHFHCKALLASRLISRTQEERYTKYAANPSMLRKITAYLNDIFTL